MSTLLLGFLHPTNVELTLNIEYRNFINTQNSYLYQYKTHITRIIGTHFSAVVMYHIEDERGFFQLIHFNAEYAKRTKRRTEQRVFVGFDQKMIEKYMQYIYIQKAINVLI